MSDTLEGLKHQTKKYKDDSEAIAQLRKRKSDAQAELAELENDTDGDIDKLADRAASLNSTIADCDFRINTLAKRSEVHRDQIAKHIRYEKQEHREYVNSIKLRRRDVARKFIESKEFQQVIEKFKALYAGGDYYSFDALLNEAIPRHCDYVDSKALAEKHDMWIPEDDISEIVREAEDAIDSDRDIRAIHEQFANPVASNSRLVLKGAA